jgi:O-antigen/teichoic acid export membrane protein
MHDGESTATGADLPAYVPDHPPDAPEIADREILGYVPMPSELDASSGAPSLPGAASSLAADADAESVTGIGADDEEALGVLVKRGLGWSFGSTAVSRAATLVSGIVLAHILAPEDYGLFTVGAVALTLLANVNDLGLEQTLIRWPGNVARIAPTATTIMFGFSLFLYAGVFVLAPTFTSLLNAPDATNIVRVLALGVVINGIFGVPSGLLTRSFRQKQRLTADMIGFVISTGLTIALALYGLGAWSLVWGRMVGNTVNSLLHLALSPARYWPGWSRPVAREILAAGLPLAGTSLLAVSVLNVDYLVVGHQLGTVALGLYLVAFNLSSWPVSMFAVAVNRVSVPGFARMQHDPDAYRAAFVRSLALLMTVTIPACVMLATLGEPLIGFLYGQQWVPAAEALRYLAILGALRVALQLASDLLVAVGKGRSTLWLQFLWLSALVPILSLFAGRDGLAGVGIGHMVVAGLVVLPAFLLVLRRMGLRPTRLAMAIARPLIGGVAAAVVAGAAATFLHTQVVILAVGGVGGLAVYAAIAWPMRHLARKGGGEDGDGDGEVAAPVVPATT